MEKVMQMTEEEMLFELFPKADRDLIMKTAESIRKEREEERMILNGNNK